MTLQQKKHGKLLLTKLAYWHIIEAMTYKIVPNACGTSRGLDSTIVLTFIGLMIVKNHMPKYLLTDIVKHSAYLMLRIKR